MHLGKFLLYLHYAPMRWVRLECMLFMMVTFKNVSTCLLLEFVLVTTSGCFDLRKSKLPSAGADYMACSECTQLHCQNAIASCSENPECKARHEYIDDCRTNGSTTSECDAQCLQNEYEYGLHTDVSVCQSEHCADECDRQCGGFIYFFDGCGECMQTRCCAESTACAKETNCLSIPLCLSRCVPGDFGCDEKCYSQIEPEIKSISDEYRMCVESCAIECGVGQAWSCVEDKNDLETRTENEITISINFNDILNESLEGVSCKVCRWDDPECENPLVQSKSRADGWVSLTYEFNKFHNNLRVEISKPGYINATLTYSRLLTGSPSTSTWPLLKPGQLQLLYGDLNNEVQSDRGHALIELKDCNLFPAWELVLSLIDADDARIYYFREGFPDLDAKHAGSRGNVGIANLPPGAVLVEASPFGQEDFTVLRETLYISPGELSYVIIWPE